MVRGSRCCAASSSVFFPRKNAPAGIRYERVLDHANREFFKIHNVCALSDAFHEVATDPRIGDLLASITGCSRLRVLFDQIQYKPPLSGGWNGWHRDMPTFPFIRPYIALTAWIPLDDVTEDNGAMTMVPGSHLWNDVGDIVVNDWGLDLSRIAGHYHGHRVRRVSRPLRAGDIHFHHEMTWHCSPPNRTRGKRRALALHYFNADACYREGGAIVYPELKQGDSMSDVAPILLCR